MLGSFQASLPFPAKEKTPENYLENQVKTVW